MAEWIINKEDVKSTVNGDFAIYRNKPLVRENNIIIYGDVKEKYYLQMVIMTEKEVRGKKVPDQIYVQLVASDPNLPPQDKVVKQGMKSGLSEALDVGVAWLERYLEM